MTSLNLPLFHPITGQRVPFGRVYRQMRDDFLESASTSAPPVWLASTGTYLWERQRDAGGFARQTSAASIDAEAGLRTAREHATTLVKAMSVTVQAMRSQSFTPASIGISLANDARTNGFVFQHRAGQPSAEFVCYNGATATTVPVPYIWQGLDGRPAIARNMTLLYWKTKGLAVALADDSVIGVCSTTGIVADGQQIRAGYFIRNEDTTAHWVQCASFHFELWQ